MSTESDNTAVDTNTPIGIILIIIVALVTVVRKERKYNEFIKSTTQEILAQAHKEALTSIDTLDLRKFSVTLGSAREDSACLANKILAWVEQQGESNYDASNMRNKHFDINEAMTDKKFAQTYGKYQKAIQQLEITRRQQNQK